MARGRALARRVSSNTDPGLGARYDHLRFLSIVFRLHVGEKLLQQHLDQRLLDRWRRRLTAFAGLNLDDHARRLGAWRIRYLRRLGLRERGTTHERYARECGRQSCEL